MPFPRDRLWSSTGTAMHETDTHAADVTASVAKQSRRLIGLLELAPDSRVAPRLAVTCWQGAASQCEGLFGTEKGN